MKLNFRAVDLIRIVYTFLAVKFFQAMSDIRVHGSIILGAIEKKVLSVLFCSLLRSFFNFHFFVAYNINRKYSNECIIEIGRFKWDHSGQCSIEIAWFCFIFGIPTHKHATVDWMQTLINPKVPNRLNRERECEMVFDNAKPRSRKIK